MITRHYYYTDNTTHRYTGKYQHLRLVKLKKYLVYLIYLVYA